MARPPLHPGHGLAAQLDESGITATELARQLGVPPNRITRIIQGKQDITGDTALRLGHWFGNGGAFWMNLQSVYELHLAEQAAGAEIAALPVRLLHAPQRPKQASLL